MTSRHIRNTIAGSETHNVLAMDVRGNRLTHVISYRGFFDEAFTVDSFIVSTPKQTEVFTTLDSAVKAWDKMVCVV